MSSLTPEVTEPRIEKWGMTLALNIITLICIVDATKLERNARDKFVLSVASMSMALAAGFFFNAKLSAFAKQRDVLTGSVLEVLAAGSIFMLWCFGLGFTNSLNTNLFGVKNANLYYSSWGCFLISIVLFGEVTFGVWGNLMNRADETRNTRIGSWALLTASNFIVMFSAVQHYREASCFRSDTKFCNRTVFAIVLGCFGGALSIMILGAFIPLKNGNKIITIETLLSLGILVSYIFGVFYITTSNGPGKNIGNLYYFTWICFFTSLAIFLLSSAKIMKIREEAETTGSNRDNPKPVETGA